MATYLVTLSLGPVQSLIEAARRTRDLWCGSWLLAEAAKAAARVLHNHQLGCLIFPCPTNPDADLAPSDKPRDGDANIANILRAQVDLADEAAVRTLLDTAKRAAADRLSELCERARAEVSGLPFQEDLWQAQKNDILESFAAWVEVVESDYTKAASRISGILAARKATRDFLPAATAADGLGIGIPKSSLDGARESVINLSRDERKNDKYKTLLRRLGLGGGEELDALAVAKRMAGDIDQFTAYSRIAADTWIETLPVARRKSLAEVYDHLVRMELATRVKGNAGIYGSFPYDAQLVFGFRLDNALTAAASGDKPYLLALRDVLRDLDQPVPYAVILKADGDRMGELLSKATSAEDSRRISQALHGFAQSVRGTVREQRGHAIYAGGDDVLALLPLEKAIPCAAALAKSFRSAMNEVAETLKVPEGQRPTLSVGLGIGHLVEPLGRLRARADAAEKDAKGNREAFPRNALAIRLGIRSGAELRWRCRWDEGGGEPKDCDGVKAMQQFIDAYVISQCPSRVGYDLRSIAERLAWVKEDGIVMPGIHAAELSRTLDRARQRGGEGELPKTLKDSIAARAGVVGLGQVAVELIIARWLSARTQSDIGALE